MPGILDYLSTLASAFAGQQQPQTPAPQQQQPTQNPQQAMPQQQQGGLTGFLSSPLTQGALGAYFGAIGSPRRSGLGGMLSQGGRTGLNAFNQAEQGQQRQQQNQLQAALQQAQIQNLGGAAQANAQLAAQIHQIRSSGQLTSDQEQRAALLESSIGNDRSKVYDPNVAIQAIYSEPLKDQLLGAQVAHTKAQTAAIPTETALKVAQTAAIPARTELERAETTRAEAEATKAEQPPEGKSGETWFDPESKQYYRGEQRKPTDIPASKVSIATPKPPDPLVELNRLRTMYAAEHPYASRSPVGGMSFEAYAVQKGYDPFTAQKLPPAPAGGGYVWDADRGQIVATDSSGKPTHVWQPD